jgi:hypothetical protein
MTQKLNGPLSNSIVACLPTRLLEHGVLAADFFKLTKI